MTETTEPEVHLAGAFDPSGFGVGFMIPVFRDPRRNSLLVQIVGPKGTIRGFEPAAAPGTIDFPAVSIPVRPRQRSYWAFRIDGELILGNDKDSRARLEDRLEASVARWPLLAMEVAEFLDLEARRDHFARRAFDALSEVSPKAAEVWRDLSVLTADIRIQLLKRLGPNAYWPRKVLATLEGGAVAIHGLPDWPSPAVLENLKASVSAATAPMPRLYDHDGEFRIAVSSVGGETAREFQVRLVVDRSIDLERLQWEMRRRGGSDVDLISLDSKDAFVVRPSMPTFFLYPGSVPALLRRAARAAAPRLLTGIALGGPVGAEGSRRLPSGIATIEIPRDRDDFGNQPSGDDAVTIRLATHIGLGVASGALKMPHRHSLLLGAAGLRRNYDHRATAKLYDMAWARGLVPWRSIRFVPDTSENLTLRERSTTAILFPGVPEIPSSVVIRTLNSEKSKSHLLISSRPHGESDKRRHAKSVSTLLSVAGWRVTPGDSDDIIVAGSAAVWNVSVTAIELGRSDPTTLRRLLHRLQSTRQLRVTCNATSGSILRHLAQRDELAVNVRDLVALDPVSSTIWTIVAAQLLRMKSSRYSRSRTLYIALAVGDALRSGRAAVPAAAALEQIVRSRTLGSANHFLIRKVSYHKHKVEALVDCVASPDHELHEPGTQIVPTFVLEIDASGAAIREPSGTR